jgi:type I restriction enzyme R subunit
LEKAEGKPKSELMALVSLVRRICGLDHELTAWDKTVDRHFQEWVFKKQAGPVKFTEEQMTWLRIIKEQIARDFHVEMEDLELVEQGGMGVFWQLFGDDSEKILVELNEVLVA